MSLIPRVLALFISDFPLFPWDSETFSSILTIKTQVTSSFSFLRRAPFPNLPTLHVLHFYKPRKLSLSLALSSVSSIHNTRNALFPQTSTWLLLPNWCLPSIVLSIFRSPHAYYKSRLACTPRSAPNVREFSFADVMMKTLSKSTSQNPKVHRQGVPWPHSSPGCKPIHSQLLMTIHWRSDHICL